MTALLSRIPFDQLSKLSDHWRSSAPTPEPTPKGNVIDTTTYMIDTPSKPEQTTVAAQSETSLASSATGPETQGPTEADFDFQRSAEYVGDVEADKASGDKAGIAELIAEYGSSSATSWLEFGRYKIWRPSVPIPQSSFPPVQGYLRTDPFVFAWGNPLVSDPAALEATCAAFIDWARSQKLRPIWLCVDGQMEKVLGSQGSKFGWSTLSCIVEDYLDPRSVVELAQSHGGGSEVKDFKKNLRRAERANVQVREVQRDQWTDAMKKQVEEGISGWKKSKTGIQIASSSFQPWLDFEHRRYWVAEADSNIVAILVLTKIHHEQYQIKNAVSFPNAPRGTSEMTIFRAMSDIQDEGASTDDSDCNSEDGACVWTKEEVNSGHHHHHGHHHHGHHAHEHHARSQSVDSHHSDSSDTSGKSSPDGVQHRGVAVTFGITASETLTPVDNLSGWRITWLSKTYNSVVGLTGLTRRGDFRNKFHSQHMPMYVCYPAEDGFGLDGVNKLVKSLRQ